MGGKSLAIEIPNQKTGGCGCSLGILECLTSVFFNSVFRNSERQTFNQSFGVRNGRNEHWKNDIKPHTLSSEKNHNTCSVKNLCIE